MSKVFRLLFSLAMRAEPFNNGSVHQRVQWLPGSVLDLQLRGLGFKSHLQLLCTNANSVCHLSGLVDEYWRKLGSKWAYHVMH